METSIDTTQISAELEAAEFPPSVHLFYSEGKVVFEEIKEFSSGFLSQPISHDPPASSLCSGRVPTISQPWDHSLEAL